MSSPKSPHARWKLAAAAAVLALVGCAVALQRPGPPGAPQVTLAPAPPARVVSAVVGGPRLPHSKHLGLGVGCADCHAPDAATGEPGKPALAGCMDCHQDLEEEADTPPEQRIAAVFFTPEGSPRWATAIPGYGGDVLFSHRAHGPLDCAGCHANLDVLPRVAAPLFTMAGCSDCHAKRGAKNDCATCHRAIRRETRPPSHGPDWVVAHGPGVRSAEVSGEKANCTYCHADPSFCNDCHTSRRPPSHLSCWETAHGRRVLEVGGPGEARCTFCHTCQAFCDDCHMATKPTSHSHLWRERHGTLWRAQDVTCRAGCAFCHDEPSFCEDCHRVTKPRDHTNLFRVRTHGVAAAIDRTRCMTCHETDFCARCHEETAPRSHRGQWARGRTTHCIGCHFPITQNPTCAVCHHENPTHDAAPDQPASHQAGINCRICHNAAGGGGAPPLRHVDNGMPCEFCHPR